MKVGKGGHTSEVNLSWKEEQVRDERAIRVRARESAGPFIAELSEWDLYVTLTYDPRRGFDDRSDVTSQPRPPSFWASRRHVAHWLAESEKMLGRRCGAVACLEAHKSGWPHWHALYAAGGLDSGEFTRLSMLWFEARGFCRFDRVNPADRSTIAQYVAKYLVKEGSETLLYGRLGSREIPGQHFLPGSQFGFDVVG